MRTPTVERPHPVGAGIQRLYFFPNGYGASVVRFSIGGYGAGNYGAEHGLFELAVLLGSREKWGLTYETPITDDVVGHLSEAEVDELLARIEALPPHTIAEKTR